ncbi:helix-turn-helix domain-containing protein [Gordonia polyisoprenivorans]|uniref:helix-turn-helix domain-containing protein n=1 Tax=Gordonia polyisoprenivorans TaxID=84595 RepID=UPI002300149E|nr:helix-turn-helix domain-containing protein [Gordonia polyisoprenivorans]WCB39039.1 helix-turn-helix domain-containing protein [Gordonia polyisoprenivorans]
MFRTPREAGIVLRSLREEANLSQVVLARRAGVSTRWLLNFENGKPSVDMSKVMDVFGALGYGFDVVADPAGTRTVEVGARK